MLTLIGILDANGSGTKALKLGPGVNLDVPIFSRNQGAIGRADAEVERASRQYAAVRAQVVADVRSATCRSSRRSKPSRAWRDEIVPSLEIEQRQAESAYQAGEIPLSRCSTSAVASSTAAPGCSTPRPICNGPRSRSNGASVVRAPQR